MVYKSTSRRKTLILRRKNSCYIVVLLSIFVLLFALIIVATYSITNRRIETANSQDKSDRGISGIASAQNTKIDFQDTINKWLEKSDGNKSVLVYDLDSNENVGEYNINKSYSIASLYKLFVVYYGYLKVEHGEWNMNDDVETTGRKVSECLDLAIRESDSACAETLESLIGLDDLAKSMRTDNIRDTNLAEITSTPADILKILILYNQYFDSGDSGLVAILKDSLLNQPATEYNWRQGLPSGFSRASVYDKVGWDYNPNGYWNTYHDAAIVEFSDGHKYIIVVMTERTPFEDIATLGSMIEDRYYR